MAAIGLGLLAVAAVVLLAASATSALRVRDHEAGLTGFWAGDRESLALRGLAGFYLFLGPASGKGWGVRRRQGFLVVTAEGGEEGGVANQEVVVTYGDTGGRARSSLGRPPRYRIRGARFASEGGAPIPPTLDLLYDAGRGSLTLLHDGEVWARAYKDAEASSWAADAYSTLAGRGRAV